MPCLTFRECVQRRAGMGGGGGAKKAPRSSPPVGGQLSRGIEAYESYAWSLQRGVQSPY